MIGHPPAGALVVEPARPGDLPAIEALLQACTLPLDGVSSHLDRFVAARWVIPPDASAAAQRAAPLLIGCAGIEAHGEACILRSLAIDPAWRGRGIARPLIAATLELARRLGFREAYLLTYSVEALARRHGFVRIERAEVPRHLLECGEFRLAPCNSAIVMRKLLDTRLS